MKACKINSCPRWYYAKGYCERHYIQMRKHGKIIGDPITSRNDSTKITFDRNVCKIELRNNLGVKQSNAIIDAEDYDLVKDKKWRLTAQGYPIAGDRKTLIRLHCLILGCKTDVNTHIDHKDGNPLNNRKSNLRKCTHSQNLMNHKIFANNVSGYSGIYFDNNINKWDVRIAFNKKTKRLGQYQDLNQAIIARKTAVNIYHGEFGRP